MTLNLSDAIRLSSLIQGVQRKRPVVWTRNDHVHHARLRRIHRFGEMPGEDFARDSDDILDLWAEVEFNDFSIKSLEVRDIIQMMQADEFFVE